MPEKFAHHRITDFCQKLASSDPTPGGGTVAALAGLLASSLLEMVLRLSLKKKPDAPGLGEILTGLPSISRALADLMDEDSSAYDGVTSAFRMPKVAEAEKAARAIAIQAAFVEAARVPMRTARACAELLDRMNAVSGEILDAARSDWTVAREMARAGLAGALANVDINIGSIKDQAFVATLQQEAAELRAKA